MDRRESTDILAMLKKLGMTEDDIADDESLTDEQKKRKILEQLGILKPDEPQQRQPQLTPARPPSALGGRML